MGIRDERRDEYMGIRDEQILDTRWGSYEHKEAKYGNI